jgi:Flp pilus assembly protein TadD
MIAEHVYGHDTPQMARSLVALGRVLRVKAALPAGRACFERALAVTEALYGPESHELIEPLNELAETLLKQGDVTGAQSYLRRAARLQQGKAYGR